MINNAQKAPVDVTILHYIPTTSNFQVTVVIQSRFEINTHTFNIKENLKQFENGIEKFRYN